MQSSLGVIRIAMDMRVVRSPAFVLDPFDHLLRRMNFRIANVAHFFAGEHWYFLFLGVSWQLLLQFIAYQRRSFLMALFEHLGCKVGWRTLPLQLICNKIWQEIPSSWFLSEGRRRIAQISWQIIWTVLVGIELIFLIGLWRVEVLLAESRRKKLWSVWR